MKSASKALDQALRQLGRAAHEDWVNDLHRERLGRELRRAQERAPERTSVLRRPRTTLVLVAALALGGVAAASAWLSDWLVTTRVGELDLGTQRIELDGQGRAQFWLPADRLDALSDLRFDFELEGPAAPWLDFDIEVEDDLARVSVQAHERAPIDPELARSAFAELRSITARDAGQLWGVDLSGPVLFVDPASRAAVANQADQEGFLFPWKGLYAGRLPADLPLANTAVSWSGVRWTMLLWPLPGEPDERRVLLTHEAFHRVQPALGLFVPSEPPAHLDRLTGRLWLRLEARALAAALRAREDSGDPRAATDALCFRLHRHSLFPNGAAAEDALERVEGTAEYTGLRLALDELAERRRVARAALESLDGAETFARSFPYATGAALGLLLDDGASEWRSALVDGASFGTLLSDALGEGAFDAMPAAELERRAHEAALRYDYAAVLAAETQRHEERAARRAELHRRFVEVPQLLLPAHEPRYSFDPRSVETLPDFGTVYEALSVSDAWGVLEAPGGGLMLPDTRGFRVPASSAVEGRTIVGDGWKLVLNPGWTVRAAAAKDGLRGEDFEVALEPR